MLTPAFAAPGHFYRGNLHCHSNLSDGALSPEEVCRRYKAEGYDFIALTDHFVGRYGYPITDTTEFRDEVFTTLLGAELHSGTQENGDLWHILAVGLPEDFAPSNSPDFHTIDGQETGPELAARAADAGAFVAMAHPHWSGLTQDDALSLERAHAVEIYNHTCATGTDRGDGQHMADLLLSKFRDVSLIATDDAHFHWPDAFGGWVMVKAEENSPEALLEALKDGHFYASQGPEIKAVSVTRDHLDIHCSAASTIVVQGHGCASQAQFGQSMTHASIPLDALRSSPWMRVTVLDAAGKRAWSNPIWR
ncbi:MAG: phosphotransferase [Rhodobacteraceae bacterium]|nr:phosphotransferase [Paracoccaceae bacterium]